jgi:hypothetical protein
MVTRVGEHCVGFRNGFAGCREIVLWIDLRRFRGKRQAGAVPEPESGLFLQEGYRQELSVDWPEAP